MRGWLPENPDDPPPLTWRGILLIAAWVVVVYVVWMAIPDAWSFWAQLAIWVATGMVGGLCLRLWFAWRTRRAPAD